MSKPPNLHWSARVVLCAGVLVTAADAFVLLLVEQWGVRQLEAVFGMFIAIMAGSFGIMYKDADIPHKEVLKGHHQCHPLCVHHCQVC